jgi:hypothetical protein
MCGNFMMSSFVKLEKALFAHRNGAVNMDEIFVGVVDAEQF